MELIDEVLAAREDSSPPGRPWVTLSFAQSLDGCIAARRGWPLGLSGPQSMRLTHQLRAAHQAILVGIGTVIADNPLLTVRLVEGPDPQPVILDSWLRMPLDAPLLQNSCRPWVATREEADPQRKAQLEEVGVRLIPLPPGQDGRLSLSALLVQLARLGVSSLMVEGGASVISAFLAQGLVDLLVLTIAPVWVGGLHAIEPGIFSSASGQAAFPRLQKVECQPLGEDLILWGRLNPLPEPFVQELRR
jgi:riboflavin-specific deaminase-like protein